MNANSNSLMCERGAIVKMITKRIGSAKAADETVFRWAKAIMEMTCSYNAAPPRLKDFDSVGYDGIIVVGPIKFWSLCEHHLFPFGGDVWIGYLPGKSKRIVGLSKLARLVEHFAGKLQVQERMTHDIAEELEQQLKTYGVGVRIESQHTCMCARGVRKEGIMRTQTLLGRFKRPGLRAEFINLCRSSHT